MKLSRYEFIQAIEFLKPALLDLHLNNGRENLTYLCVEFKDNDCILTAGNAFIIKRVTLKSLTDDQFQQKNEMFLINQPALFGFMKILKTQTEPDKDCENYDYIGIGIKSLESDLVKVGYTQPDLEYPSIDRLFIQEGGSCEFVGLSAKLTKDVLHGFPKSNKAIKFSFSGPEKPVLLRQLKTTYEAVILPCKLSEKTTNS